MTVVRPPEGTSVRSSVAPWQAAAALALLLLALEGTSHVVARTPGCSTVAQARGVRHVYCPALLDFVHTYHEVLPSTSMYRSATYALLASERLRRRSLSIGWGAALGLTVLSQPMAIADAPEGDGCRRYDSGSIPRPSPGGLTTVFDPIALKSRGREPITRIAVAR